LNYKFTGIEKVRNVERTTEIVEYDAFYAGSEV